VQLRWPAGLVLVAALGGAGGAASRPAEPRALEILRLPGHRDIGAAFAGKAVLWTDSTAEPPVLDRLERGVSRPLWRGRAIPLPAGEPAGTKVVQAIADVAASSTAAAFVYGVGVLQPGPIACEICYRPLFTELWVGRPQGPFHRARGLPQRCAELDALDAGPRDVVVSEAPAPCAEGRPVSPKIVSVPVARGRRAVLTQSTAFRFVRVAAAGRYVAWATTPMDCGRPRVPCSRAGVTLYDRTTRRVALRLNAKQLGMTGAPSLSLALQPDGKIATVAFGANRGRLAWASPSSPRPHLVAAAPLDYPVAMSGDRIVFPTRDTAALDVSDLRGRTRTLDRFVPSGRWFPGTLDASGGRVLWVVASSAPSTSILAARLR
jgi:hypothetical protein